MSLSHEQCFHELHNIHMLRQNKWPSVPILYVHVGSAEPMSLKQLLLGFNLESATRFIYIPEIDLKQTRFHLTSGVHYYISVKHLFTLTSTSVLVLEEGNTDNTHLTSSIGVVLKCLLKSFRSHKHAHSWGHLILIHCLGIGFWPARSQWSIAHFSRVVNSSLSTQGAGE